MVTVRMTMKEQYEYTVHVILGNVFISVVKVYNVFSLVMLLCNYRRVFSYK